jgi:hypothetical protein
MDQDKQKNRQFKKMSFDDVKYIIEQKVNGVINEVPIHVVITFGCIDETEDSLILAVLYDNTNHYPVGCVIKVLKNKITEYCQSGTCVIYSTAEFNSKYPKFMGEFKQKFEEDYKMKYPDAAKPTTQEPSTEKPETTNDNGPCVVTCN